MGFASGNADNGITALSVLTGVDAGVGVGVGVTVGVGVGVAVKLGMYILLDAGEPLLTMLLKDNLLLVANRCCLIRSVKLGGVAMCKYLCSENHIYGRCQGRLRRCGIGEPEMPNKITRLIFKYVPPHSF